MEKFETKEWCIVALIAAALIIFFKEFMASGPGSTAPIVQPAPAQPNLAYGIGPLIPPYPIVLNPQPPLRHA